MITKEYVVGCMHKNCYMVWMSMILYELLREYVFIRTTVRVWMGMCKHYYTSMYLDIWNWKPSIRTLRVETMKADGTPSFPNKKPPMKKDEGFKLG